MRTLFRKLGWWLRRDRKDAELSEELQFHLDEEAAGREADGLPPDRAARAARLNLGNRTVVEEQVRAVWTWTLLEQLVQDIRYATRAMVHNRAFTALTVLSLALGIGANTAIYSFMDAILMRSLPVRDPASLAVVNWHSRVPTRDAQGNRESVMHSMSGSTFDDALGVMSGIFPFPAFELLQKQSSAVFSTVFAYYPNHGANLLIDGQADVGRGEYVSGDYFPGLGVNPAAGRLLVADDDREGAASVVVVSLAFSERHFGGADRAPGRSIRINAIPFTIVGVTPPEFFGVDPASAPDFYLPMHANLLVDGTGLNRVTRDQYLAQDYYWVEMMARLRPGVSRDEAQSALAPLFHQWVSSTAATPGERANLPALSLRDGGAGLDNLRRQYSAPLFMLLMVVALILLLACANTANLLLARSAARRREMAVRLSIGAERFRVVRQLLTESVLLASLGGLVGVLLAMWGVRVLTLLLANGREDFTLRAEMNWRVLLATLGVSVLCGTFFGLAPALRATSVDVMPALKDVRAGTSPSRRRGFRWLSLSRALVVSQIAVSLLLLVTAALFVRTLSNLHAVELGFNQQNVLLFEINARQAGHQDPEIATFYESLRRNLAGNPGVQSATLSQASIIGAGRQLDIRVSGRDAPGTRILSTGPRFFTTMQIPLLLGREMDERDQPRSSPVAVVNELFAKLNFGDSNPVGRHITLGGPTPRDMEIVGVSANVRYQGLKEPFVPVVFIPYDQGDWPPIEQMTYALRTTGNPLSYVEPVRDIVHRADARVPLTEVKTQAGEIDETINQEIVFAKLCSGFAILALVIASVGLYGTTAYGVARRTSEIGIRIALGARRERVVLMVLREVMMLAALGLAIGVPAALGLSRLVESFLFGLKPADPVALAVSVAILWSAAILAGYVPARRASRIEPLTALRHE